MPKASEVASELRKLADVLDKGGDVTIKQPYVFFSSHENKEQFLNIVGVLPRPLRKKLDPDTDTYGELKLEYESPAMWLRASVYRSVICTMIEPAKPAVYECEPLLSQLEQEQVDANV